MLHFLSIILIAAIKNQSYFYRLVDWLYLQTSWKIPTIFLTENFIAVGIILLKVFAGMAGMTRQFSLLTTWIIPTIKWQ